MNFIFIFTKFRNSNGASDYNAFSVFPINGSTRKSLTREFDTF